MSSEHNNPNNDIVLTFEEVVLTTGCDADWVLSLLEENVIALSEASLSEASFSSVGAQNAPKPQTSNQALKRVGEQYFTGHTLARIRRAQRICRDFDASVPAVGLILELLDELEGYRKRFN